MSVDGAYSENDDMKRFNTTGTCFPEDHYMVDLTERIHEIRKMVDQGDYFCINRGRQFGKTTTLNTLKDALQDDYTVFSISFERIEDKAFENTETLSRSFIHLLFLTIKYKLDKQLSPDFKYLLTSYEQESGENISLDILSERISELCMANEKPIVIIIDEVDQASNHISFLKFLSMLRDMYLNRKILPTFHSVILAGVYDIKNLKLKIRSDSEHQYNSPWNIAAKFDVVMELTENGIVGMLQDYENDHHTGMDITAMAKRLSDYTGGYPFLVSRLCQIMDEELPRQPEFKSLSDCWTAEGFLAAVKALLIEGNTLFDDMIKKIDEFHELRKLLHGILCAGRKVPFQRDDKAQSLALMFNFIKNDNGKVAVFNRIFETRLYNLFIYEDSQHEQDLYDAGSLEKSAYIRNGRLDMDTVMERFVVHYTDLFGHRHKAFAEADARQCFLIFLMPVINGTGHYYVEAQTRDERRMDVVVNYAGEQFIIELKIWRGQVYNDRGVDQLCDYLDSMHEQKGYLLTFNFNEKKQSGMHTTQVRGKTIVEVNV